MESVKNSGPVRNKLEEGRVEKGNVERKAVQEIERDKVSGKGKSADSHTGEKKSQEERREGNLPKGDAMRGNVSVEDARAQRKPEKEAASGEGWKTVLLWDAWYGLDWSVRFEGTKAGELKALGCPSWRCNFTYDHQSLRKADALLFRYREYPWQQLWKSRVPGQVWVYVIGEPPSATPPIITPDKVKGSLQVDWLMTYHPESEVVASYGFFISINSTQRPLRPNLMTSHPEAVRKVKEALADEENSGSEAVVKARPYVVAWMVSHCDTRSKREKYVKEMRSHLTVHTYGECGNLECPREAGESPLGGRCWREELQPKYSFYLAFENVLCSHYITEKAYNALAHYIVPVVWGGADYNLYLPPHSFIDARHYHPKDLAALLLHLHANPKEYARYHTWRAYLKPVLGGSMCELCHRLHHTTTTSTTRPYHHIGTTRYKRGNCTS